METIAFYAEFFANFITVAAAISGSTYYIWSRFFRDED